MDVKMIEIEGIPFRVPAALLRTPKWLADFPDCCGAGDGFGEKSIPETMYFLRVSPS